MTGQKFSKSAAIKFGWDTATANLALLVLAVMIVIAIGVMPHAATDSWVVITVAAVLQMVVGMGILRMTLRFVDGDRGELVDLFSTFPLLVTYLIASVAVAILVAVGYVYRCLETSVSR